MRQSTKILCLSIIAFANGAVALFSDHGLTNTVLPVFMLIVGMGGLCGGWEVRKMENLEQKVRGK